MAPPGETEHPARDPQLPYYPAPMLYGQMPQYPFMPQWPSPQWMMPPAVPPFFDQPNYGFPNQHYPGAAAAAGSNQTGSANDDYMVNSLSRIYNNSDGSIEIERVKVHRLSGLYDQTSVPSISHGNSYNSSGQIVAKKPPPRRKKRNREMVQQPPPGARETYLRQMGGVPYGYPYPYGFMPYIPPAMYAGPQIQSPGSSDGSTIRADTGSGPSSEHRSTFSKHATPSPEIFHSFSTESGPTFEYVDGSMSETFSTTTEDISKDDTFFSKNDSPSPALPIKVRKNRHKHGNDSKNQFTSPTNSPVASTDLIYSFKKLEKNLNSFKTQLKEMVKEDGMDLERLPKKSVEPQRTNEIQDRFSEASTRTLDSRQSHSSGDITDTDSTEILFSSENEEELSQDEEGEYRWILIEHTETCSNSDTADDSNHQLSVWKTQLIESLCRGQGLDDPDWSIFQSLVQSDLAIKSKMSILNANGICSVNNNVGVAMLRNSLLQVIKYGEMVLKPISDRDRGWKSILADHQQPWTQVKGCIEILNVFGYRRIGTKLRFNRNTIQNQLRIGRLTLDILVLAEEFRLYLTGVHMSPQNITNLFTKNFKSSTDLGCAMQSFCAVNITDPPPGVNLEPSVRDSKPAMQLTEPSYVNNSDELQKCKDDECVVEQEVNETPIILATLDETTTVEPIKRVPKQKTAPDIKKRKVKAEEHIYEEIEEVKAQVDDLRKHSGAPPLPPKSKTKLRILGSIQSREDSSHSKISTSCSNISTCGSVISRRRKRRAPMPPSFSEDKFDSPTHRSASNEKLSGCAPLEHTSPVTDTQNLNPFYQKETRLKGYIGKNPFYEDLVVGLPDKISHALDLTTANTECKDKNKIEAEVLKESKLNVSSSIEKLAPSNKISEEIKISTVLDTQTDPKLNKIEDNLSNKTIACEKKSGGENTSDGTTSPERDSCHSHDASNSDTSSTSLNTVMSNHPSTVPIKQCLGGEPQLEDRALLLPVISLNDNTPDIVVDGEAVSAIELPILLDIPTENKTPPVLPPKAALKLVDDIPFIDTNIIESIETNQSDDRIEDIVSINSVTDISDPQSPPSLPSTSPPSSRPPSPTTSLPTSDELESDSPVLFLVEKEQVDHPLSATIENCLSLPDGSDLSDEVKRLSLHKEGWTFPSREPTELDRSSMCSADSDSDQYEIPEDPNMNNVASNCQLSMDEKSLNKNSADMPSSSSENPLAPRRKKKCDKRPPRPPKPKESPPPTLPPKSNPNLPTQNPNSKLKVLPEQQADPRSSPNKWKHKSFSKLRGAQSVESSKALPNRSTSTPSSPMLSQSRDNSKPNHGKTRRSWPSIFRDCLESHRKPEDKPKKDDS